MSDREEREQRENEKSEIIKPEDSGDPSRKQKGLEEGQSGPRKRITVPYAGRGPSQAAWRK